MAEDTEWRVMGTGSRSIAKESYSARMAAMGWIIDELEDRLEMGNNLIVISGGAEGWDELIATAAWFINVPYHLVLPNTGYGDYYWRRNSVTGLDRSEDFELLVNHAAKVIHCCKDAVWLNGVHANFIRNQWMVNMADEALVYQPQSRGTADAVARLNQFGTPWREYNG